MKRAVGWTWLLVMLCAAPGASPQSASGMRLSGSAVPFVEDFTFDGGVSEWRGRPVDKILDPTAASPQILLWIGQVDAGLVVAAEIRAGTADLPSVGTSPLLVSVAGASEPDMPPIGWGHQFGNEVLADSIGCDEVSDGPAACRDWYRRQVAHRETLPPLFRRTWSVDLSSTAQPIEVEASAAFERLGAPDRLSALAPRGLARSLSREIRGTPGGVGLELLIPWSSFPPVRAPDLDAIRLEVGTGGSVGSGLASSGAPRPLARPLRHRITPCESGLSGVFIRGGANRHPRAGSEGAVVYMIPEPTRDLRRLVILDNHVAGYQYGPDPQALSPEAFETAFEVVDLGAGRRLCTPSLALAEDGGRQSPADWTHTGEGDPWARFADLKDLEIRQLDDGRFLALSGPKVFWSYYGSGQCGACPRVSVEIFHLDTGDGTITRVLNHQDLAEPGARDIEMEVAPDWSHITVYRSETDWEADPIETSWSLTRYCRRDGSNGLPTYDVCAEEENVPEPPLALRARYEG